MKPKLYYLVALILISACSAPKYAYHFDRYNYNSGKKSGTLAVSESVELSPVNAESLIASKDNTLILTGVTEEKDNAVAAKSEVRKTYAQMTKAERKEFRADLKSFIKEKKESIKAAKKTNAMDNDLKLAAIFGAVGLVALIISGDVFYIIGGIALIIGVVFFVKWLVRQ